MAQVQADALWADIGADVQMVPELTNPRMTRDALDGQTTAHAVQKATSLNLLSARRQEPEGGIYAALTALGLYGQCFSRDKRTEDNDAKISLCACRPCRNHCAGGRSAPRDVKLY